VIIMAMQRGRLILWISGLAIAGIIAWAFRSPAVPVDLAAIGRGDLRVTIDEEGMTRVRERYVVSAPVAGRLQRIGLKAGDTVDADTTVLATFLPATPTPLDPRVRAETEARLKSARATREQAGVAQQRARDEAGFSRNELKRYREIAKFGGTTDEHLAALDLDVRTRDAQLRAADLAVQAAEHEIEAVAALLRQFAGPSASHRTSIVLRSPISGVVLRIHQESEALVAAGTPLVEVGNPRQLEIVADLLSTDAVKVKSGFAAMIRAWGGDATLCARVRRVEPAGFTKISALGVEEQRVNVVLDFQQPQHGIHQLGDAYRVEVSVVVWERAGVLKVPTSALFRTAERWAVFAVRDGRAVQTEIEVGQRNALEAEVLSGLAEGDQVIVHPGDTVHDGAAVIERG
jgi:HlyD family secretion protein